MTEMRCYECGYILSEINAWCPQCFPMGNIPGTVDHANYLVRKTTVRAEAAETQVAQLQARVAELEADYSQVVDKFDGCRAALARRVKADTGVEPTPPDEDSRPWHEWLIERSDAALQQEPNDGK